MKIHRRFSVFGSRLLYVALAPWLLVCIPLFPYMAFNFGQSSGVTVLAFALSAICFLGLLVATDSWRFIWLNIGLLLLVPLAYGGYFFQVFFVDGARFTMALRPSEPTPLNALVGMLIWGVPAFFGARRLSRKARRIRLVESKRRARLAGGLTRQR